MKYFFILFWAFLSISFSFATSFQNNEELKKSILEFSQKFSPQINYQENNSNCPVQPATTARPTANLISKTNEATVALSILSPAEANQLFAEMAAVKYIPFGYPYDGCYARAHQMAILMENKGIISGKAFVAGDILIDTDVGEINWGYHVAPVVFVQEKDGLVPYVIDPSLSKKIIPYTEWKAMMLVKPASIIDDEYFTNRFAFSPSDRSNELTEFDPAHIEHTQLVLQDFMELQMKLQKK